MSADVIYDTLPKLRKLLLYYRYQINNFNIIFFTKKTLRFGDTLFFVNTRLQAHNMVLYDNIKNFILADDSPRY